MRTAATQAIAAKFHDQVQCQTTFPSSDPTRAHGEVQCVDGRIYRVDVTLVRAASTNS